MQPQIFEIYKLAGLSFFSKCPPFDVDFRNAANNWEMFLVSYIIAFCLAALASPYYKENTCCQQWMCLQTFLRF